MSKISIPIKLCIVTTFFVAGVYYCCLPGKPLSKTEIAHAVSLFHNMNKVTVCSKDTNEIDPAKVKVLWNDSRVIFNGGLIQKPGYTYGENTLSVYYKDQLVDSYSHHKFNNWHSHYYRINLQKKNDTLSVEWKVTGPDAGFNP